MASRGPARCADCHQEFSRGSSLDRHRQQQRCTAGPPKTPTKNVPEYVQHIKGDIHVLSSFNSIIDALPSVSLKFQNCQVSGIFKQGLYPLIFNFKRSKAFKSISHFETESDSSELLVQIIKERLGEPVYLLKNIKLHLNGSVYDLSQFTAPCRSNDMFTVTDAKDFFKVALNEKLFQGDPFSPLLPSIASMSVVTPKASISKESIRIISPGLSKEDREKVMRSRRNLILELTEAEERILEQDDSSNAPRRQQSQSSVDMEQENIPDNGQNVQNNGGNDGNDHHDDENNGHDEGEERDENEESEDDTETSDSDDGGGPPGGGPPDGGGDPSSNESDQLSDNDEAMNEDQLTFEEMQATILQNREHSLQTYAGFLDFHRPDLRRRKARELLSISSSSIQQYLSNYHFPEVMTDREMRYMTGCSRPIFNDLLELIEPSVIRVRTYTEESKLFLYLEKLRRGTKNEDLAFSRRTSEERCREIFWELAAKHYMTETMIPFRSHDIPDLNLPSPQEILEQNVVTDPYILAIFQPTMPPGHELECNHYDHTYIPIPKVSDPKNQRNTFCNPKKQNVVKFGTLCNFKGKAIGYTPMSSSNTPDAGDGNLLMIQLSDEVQQNIAPRLDPLLRPQGGNKCCYTFFDKGYVINKGNRQNDLTLDRYYNDPTVPGHDPRHKYFSVIDPGDPILDDMFNRIPNPHPVNEQNPRSKYTCAEANTIRVTTCFRYNIEICFGGIKQFQFLNQKKTDFHFLDPMGSLLPENLRDIPKLEVLYNNILGLYNRVHPGFQRTFPIPDGYTPETFGLHFRERFSRSFNPLDPIEGIRYSRHIDNFPTRLQDRGYNRLSIYNFQEHEFIPLSLQNMTLVTLGSYQIKNNRQYITDMTNYEVADFLSGIDENVVQLNFHDYDLLMSGLPTAKEIFIYDERQMPANWPERFGPWIPQRWIACSVPSYHSNKVFHDVLISFVPPSFEANEANIPNPFNFTLPGYRRIVGYACFSKNCKIGFRNLGCCSHVAAVLIFLGVYIHDRNAFKNLYRDVHKLDIRNPVSLNRQLFGANFDNQDDIQDDIQDDDE